MSKSELIDVHVPQMGEGLQEVRILQLLRQPGEEVQLDGLLYSMETDKANVDVESPVTGVLSEWLVTEGEVVPVGAAVARIQGNADVTADQVPQPEHETSAASQVEEKPVIVPIAVSRPASAVRVPPKTVAYCRQRGISEEVMRRIPAQGASLSIADVEVFLSERLVDDEDPLQGYQDIPLTPTQAGLKFRMERSALVTVPAVVKATISWSVVEAARKKLQTPDQPNGPSHFQVIAYCVAQATKDHPKFRSTLIDKNSMRQYDHVNLGFAVALPNDDLVTAVVRDADLLDPVSLGRAMMKQLRVARRGEDQAGKDTQITLSYMPDQGIVDGIPVFVAPAVATIFVGAHHRADGGEVAHLVLSFDHRLINGLGAAKFLQTVKINLDRLAV